MVVWVHQLSAHADSVTQSPYKGTELCFPTEWVQLSQRESQQEQRWLIYVIVCMLHGMFHYPEKNHLLPKGSSADHLFVIFALSDSS